MIAYGDRTRALPAPPHVVWDDLVARKATGTRAWLELAHDEVRPEIVESERPSLVVWSSLWPSRCHDLVRMELSAKGRYDTALRFVLLTPGDPPDDQLTRHLRYRVNRLLWADLRESYGQ